MSSTGPAAVLEAAELCSVAGDHADAAHLLAEALITGPSDPDLLRALAAAQFAIGWDGCALALLAEAHRVAPDDEAVITDRNIALRDHGRFVQALAVLGTAPRRLLRANTYTAMNLPTLAVDTHPAGLRSHWERTGGLLQFRRRRREEERVLAGLVEAAGPPARAAVDMCALLTRIVNGTAQDRDALAACGAATAHLDGGRRAEAATVLADALRRDSTHPLLLRRAALVAERLGRKEPALALYRRLAADPSPIEVLVRQCTLLIEMGRLPEAVRFADSLPVETAGARALRRVVARAYHAAGLPAAACGAFDADDRQRRLWWQTGGPLPAVRRRLRRRDEEAIAAWAALSVEEVLGPLASVPASELMVAAAHAADALHRAERAEERAGRDAAIDVLAAGGQDPQIVKELAVQLFLADREDETLARLDDLAASHPDDIDVVDGRVAALTWLDRPRAVVELLEAAAPAIRATPLVREREAAFFAYYRLRVLALDAIGPAPTTPQWSRGRRRALWWRTGGPLWMVRQRMRDTDRAALAAWRRGVAPLLSTLDAVVPAADPAARSVVDGHALDVETVTLWWQRANAVVRAVAGVAAAVAASPVLGAIAGSEFEGAVAAGAVYLTAHLLLFPAARADDRRAVITRAAPLIAGFALAGTALYRGQDGPQAFAGAMLVAVAAVGAARLAAAAGCRLVAAWAMRRFQRRAPRAVALTETLAMLDELRRVGRRNDLRWRRFWVERLERIAYAVEHDLPASFGLVDPDTHRQLTDGGRGAARAVRQLKFLVAAPASADAWRRVEEVLRHNAGALATGELGRLRRAAAVAVPAPVRRSRRTVATEALRVAVFAGLPLAAVYLAQPWLSFSETVHDWAKVIGLAWALLYLLLHLDPTLREKLGTVLAVLGQGQPPSEERPEALARFRDSARSAAP
ncbi:hypothetical protein AB0J72_56510 [Dactylosporangium sp. NPDC049742]|uniref:hypothetical protein n=1 Tax=Dactylosporangium sp. NPDC049742 TaxID=3154737 RepID=UPI00341A0A87